jgi:hypothetical protein
MSSSKEAEPTIEHGDVEIPLEDLNDRVMAYATERRLINGALAEIIYRPPLLPASRLGDTRAKRPARDPEEADRIRAHVNKLAAEAYEEQQRYLRRLQMEDTTVSSSGE